MATFTKNFSSGWGQLVLTVTESGTSATTNSGKISWSLKIKMLVASPSYSNGTSTVTVTIGGKRRYTGDSWDVRGVAAGSSKTIASGSFTQTHSSDGSLSLSVAASISSSTQFGSASLSGTFKGTTIPRATTPSVSPTTVALGSAVTISTPRASSAFTHNLYYKIGSGSWTRFATGVGTSYSWTVPKSIASSFPSNSSGTITIGCNTYNGSTQIGSTKSISLNFTIPSTSEFMPSVSSLSVAEAVSGVTSAFGNRYVQGLSKLNISVSASGAYGSSIRSYSTIVDGVTYTSSTFQSNTINQSGTLTITTTVSDSRGRTANKSTTISVLAYSPPTITSMTYQQCDADGTANPTGSSTKITISGRVTDVASQNTRSLTLKWKKSTDSAYQTRTLTTSGYTFTVSTIVNSTTIDETYEFVAVLSDKINIVENTITTGIIALSMLAGGKGARFGGEASKAGLAIDWPITSKNDHDFVAHGNEFTFIPSAHTGSLWFNYRTQGGKNGSTSDYCFGDGAGGYSNVNSKLLVSTGVGPTVKIGSQNSGLIHFMSSGVPFYFNKETIINGIFRPYSNDSFNLGTGSYKWRYVHAKGFVANNSEGYWAESASGTDTLIMGISASNNIALGDCPDLNNTNIYAGNYIQFACNQGGSYNGQTVQIMREQSGSYRTIFRPTSNGTAYIGSTSFRWNTAFFTNAITASDLKEKEVIDDFDFKAEEMILGLKPIAYRRKGENDGGKRIHMGFGAQDVAKVIDDLGIGDMSIVQASVIEEKEVERENESGEKETVTERVEKPYNGEAIDDEKLSWGLNYNELIAPIVLLLQEQNKKIKELSERIKELEAKVKE